GINSSTSMGIATSPSALPASFDDTDDDFIVPLTRDTDERHALFDTPLTVRPPRWHLWALVALTLLGGCLRFFRIGHPTFWIDESFTYWRVSGSYAELINILREGGFTPLHYEAYWVLGKF